MLIASISGNLRAVPRPGDHRIEAWKDAGRLKAALAQTKLATVEASIIRLKRTNSIPRTGGFLSRFEGALDLIDD